jgi:hypothetical protein
MTQNEKEYSATEVGRILGLHFSTVLKAIKDGDIKARAVKKIKKTYWYISQKELDRLKKELGTD